MPQLAAVLPPQLLHPQLSQLLSQPPPAGCQLTAPGPPGLRPQKAVVAQQAQVLQGLVQPPQQLPLLLCGPAPRPQPVLALQARVLQGLVLVLPPLLLPPLLLLCGPAPRECGPGPTPRWLTPAHAQHSMRRVVVVWCFTKLGGMAVCWHLPCRLT